MVGHERRWLSVKTLEHRKVIRYFESMPLFLSVKHRGQCFSMISLSFFLGDPSQWGCAVEFCLTVIDETFRKATFEARRLLGEGLRRSEKLIGSLARRSSLASLVFSKIRRSSKSKKKLNSRTKLQNPLNPRVHNEVDGTLDYSSQTWRRFKNRIRLEIAEDPRDNGLALIGSNDIAKNLGSRDYYLPSNRNEWVDVKTAVPFDFVQILGNFIISHYPLLKIFFWILFETN